MDSADARRLLAGVAAGVLIGWVGSALFRRPRRPRPAAGATTREGETDRERRHEGGGGWGDRWEAALDAAARGIRGELPPPTLDAAAAALAEVPGADGVSLRLIGPGIVDLEGHAPAEVVHEVVRQLGALPGVRGVVHRIRPPLPPDADGN